MNCAVNVHSITHLVKAGMADTIVSEIERLEAENATLRAEVERLTKAGDGVLNSLDLCYMGKKLHLLSSVIAWNAAKEGKQP